MYLILTVDVRVQKNHGRMWDYLEIMTNDAHQLQNKQLPFTEGLCARHCASQALVPWKLAPPPQLKLARWVLLFAPFPRWWHQSLERLKTVLGARGSQALRQSRLPSVHPRGVHHIAAWADPRPWVSLIKNKHHSELHFQGNICYFIGKSWYSHIYSFIQQLGNLWNTKENKNAPMSYRLQRGRFHLLYPHVSNAADSTPPREFKQK